MAKKHPRKLVRDKIPEILDEAGKSYKCHRATDKTYLRFLAKKLVEEAREFKEDLSPEELADVYEVMWAISTYMGHKHWTPLAQKAKERGRFTERIILDWVEE
jgi:predicted house-cleaning noncanonical NTP pyrophosphatase (MazG superfamily)